MANRDPRQSPAVVVDKRALSKNLLVRRGEVKRQREVRLDRKRLDAIHIRRRERIGLPHALDHAAAALGILQHARVHRRGAELRVTAVDGPADDDGPSRDLLVADEVRRAVPGRVAHAVGRAAEAHRLGGEHPARVWDAFLAALTARLCGWPEGLAAGEVAHWEVLGRRGFQERWVCATGEVDEDEGPGEEDDGTDDDLVPGGQSRLRLWL